MFFFIVANPAAACKEREEQTVNKEKERGTGEVPPIPCHGFVSAKDRNGAGWGSTQQKHPAGFWPQGAVLRFSLCPRLTLHQDVRSQPSP